MSDDTNEALRRELDKARGQIDEAQRAVARMVRHAEQLERERNEVLAQLAALREAVLLHQNTAYLWNREVSSAEEFAESMGTLIDADTRLGEALAASRPPPSRRTRGACGPRRSRTRRRRTSATRTTTRRARSVRRRGSAPALHVPGARRDRRHARLSDLETQRALRARHHPQGAGGTRRPWT